MPKEIQRGYRYNSLIVALFHIIEMYEIKHQIPEEHFIKTAFFPFQGCSEALQEWTGENMIIFVGIGVGVGAAQVTMPIFLPSIHVQSLFPTPNIADLAIHTNH